MNPPAARTHSKPQSKALQDYIGSMAVEGIHLTDDELAMFAMFEREGWSHERRRTYILNLFTKQPK